MGNGVQLDRKSGDALTDDLPDRFILQPEISMGQDISQTCNSSSGNRWMAIAHRVRDLFGGFTEQLEVAQYRIGDKVISRKLHRAQPMAVTDHPGAEELHVAQKESPIPALLALRQEGWPRLQCVGAAQPAGLGGSPGPPERSGDPPAPA